LKIELNRLGKMHEGLVTDVRGYGTHLAFDTARPDSLQRWFFKTGINVQKSGENTIALRPSVNLSVHDAAVFRGSLENYHPNFEQL